MGFSAFVPRTSGRANGVEHDGNLQRRFPGTGRATALRGSLGPDLPRVTLETLLLQRGLLSPSQVDEARQLQATSGLRFDRAVIQLGLLSEQKIWWRPARPSPT